MKEIEVKILEVDVEKVIERLKEIGAEKTLDTVQEVIIYDNAEGTLSKGQLLRLRKNGEVTELTYKKRMGSGEWKVSDEREVHVSDFETARKILAGIGLKEIMRYTKKRITYHLDSVNFEIDTFPGIPTFLEIETESEELLEEYVQRLGFTMKDTKPWTGKDVLEHYGKLEEFNL